MSFSRNVSLIFNNGIQTCKNIFEMGWLILAVKNFTNYINFIKRRKDVQQKPKSLLLEMSEVTLVSEKMKQKTNHSNNFILKSHFNILRGLLLLPSDVSINYPLHLLKKKIHLNLLFWPNMKSQIIKACYAILLEIPFVC